MVTIPTYYYVCEFLEIIYGHAFSSQKSEDRNRLSRFEQNYGTSDCPNVENVLNIAALVECTDYKIQLLLAFEMHIGAFLNFTFFSSFSSSFSIKSINERLF